jgi:uroporphyrinogen decarboxylase
MIPQPVHKEGLTTMTSPLSPKERMRRALQRQPLDRIPTQINYTAQMGARLAAHFGVPLSDLPHRLGNHFLRVDLTYPKRLSEDGRASYDWWGVGWDTETEGYWPAQTPLADSTDLDAFAWPDPTADDLLDGAAQAIAQDGGCHFVAPNFGFALFERAWSLRGFEKLLMDLVLDEPFVAELLDRITEIQVVLAQRFVALGVDGGYFGDDYGAQKGLIFSPKIWRRLFKPRLARMFAVFRQANLPVILHSDGDIEPLLPDLVEIGLTALNPVQPEVLDLAWLKATFGDKLAFYGGVSTQTVLPEGTPAEVKEAVATAIRILAAEGSGLLLAPSHRMMSDIPMENVDAFLEAAGVEGDSHRNEAA